MDDSIAHPPSRIRIGNPERNVALEQLSVAFTEGYLDVHEFDQRTASAASATFRDELDTLFDDLPDRTTPTEMDVHTTGDLSNDSASATGSSAVDLDDVMTRGKKVAKADAIIWSVAMAMFFLGLFVFSWSYFWLAPIAGGIASVIARAIIGFSDEEEEVYDELEEAERQKRAERLEIAKQHRLELESE